MTFTVHEGDSLAVMPLLVHAAGGRPIAHSIVSDPPYGLSFMGKSWDHGVPGVPFWEAALQCVPPGGHLLAFGGSRTWHRLAAAIEDAGWEIRDSLMWVYGSGFPKSLDVGKAIDKAAGAKRDVVGVADRKASLGSGGRCGASRFSEVPDITAPATDAAKEWDGWGTALKPAWEPIILARRPIKGTIAANVLTHSTGAINVDGCRVGTEEVTTSGQRKGTGNAYGWAETVTPEGFQGGTREGRWPANFILDPEAAALLDAQSGDSRSPSEPVRQGGRNGYDVGNHNRERLEGFGVGYGDAGGASRFFFVARTGDSRFHYTAKASRSERDAGLDDYPLVDTQKLNEGGIKARIEAAGKGKGRNVHPTVKPLSLMRWLVRLITPLHGTVLDPFMGSGSTGCAALLEDMRFVGIDLSPQYCALSRARMLRWSEQLSLFGPPALGEEAEPR